MRYGDVIGQLDYPLIARCQRLFTRNGNKEYSYTFPSQQQPASPNVTLEPLQLPIGSKDAFGDH